MSIDTLILSSRPTSHLNDNAWELSGLTGGLILGSWILILLLFVTFFCLTITMCVDKYRTHRYPVEQGLTSESSSGSSKRTEHALDLVSANGYD